MKSKTRKTIGAVALIGALAAGGAAFTAGNPLADQTQSYSSAHINGALASSLTFQYSADGSYVTQATVVLAGNESSTGSDAPYLIKAGFTGTGPFLNGTLTGAPGPTPSDDLGTVCDAATGTTTIVYASPNTTVTCDLTASGPADAGWATGLGYLTQQSSQFNLLVTGENTDTLTGTP